MEIDAETKLILLLGHPVRHSVSPLMHNRVFEELGLPLVYLAADVEPDLLAPAVEGLRALGVIGANVTLPHKVRVMTLLDAVDEYAARIGAVNTIVNSHGRLLGYNTDAQGFMSALEAQWGGDVASASILLLGAGGAARAVAAVLAQRRVKELRIWNRTPAKAHSLCRDALDWGAVRCVVVDIHEPSWLKDVDVVVQATSSGLTDAVKEPLIPVDILREDTFVMDLQYGGSPLVAAAVARGLRSEDGLEMLVRQASLSFRLWTGLSAPEHAMRAAAAG
ncbi:MAG: Shikimate dehydrogenase [Actinobacteria bacterium ADurb.Bin444]|nr:MAG: Shikimate dehydrogenase [Actinobacteria bacterium ADurb.Bin444]